MGKIDLVSSEQDWKEVLRFLDHWSLPLKSKQAYTKSEMLDFIHQVSNKFGEIESVTNFERRKAEEYKEEARLLNVQVEQMKEQYFELTASIKDIRKEFLKH